MRCIHPDFLSGLYGEVRHSEAEGYSSLAYRLVGYAEPDEWRGVRRAR
jgi:hypothetical protein